MNMRYLICSLLLLCIVISCGRTINAEPALTKEEAGAVHLEGVREEGMYLEINKRTNRLTVYMNGLATHSFPVATGRSEGLTPSGQFRITAKLVKPWYVRKQIPGGHKDNPLGTRWLGINVPGTGGYTYGIHGTNRPWSIGSRASSGCIRMRNSDVEWLYRHVRYGTVVIIKNE